MNWLRTILDGLMMSAVFNIGIALVWMLFPDAFAAKMYPKELKEAAPWLNDVSKKPIRLMYVILYPPILIYAILSAYNAGVTGFWNLFWMGYIEFFCMNLGDFFGLDIFFREKMGDKLVVKGTEGHPLYERKNWLKKLGIPEHWVAWPFVICPIGGLLLAGIVTWLR